MWNSIDMRTIRLSEAVVVLAKWKAQTHCDVPIAFPTHAAAQLRANEVNRLTFYYATAIQRGRRYFVRLEERR